MLLSLAAMLAACSTTNTVQTGTYRYLYDYESRHLHPAFVVYHTSDDSTTIYFKIRSEELLYARTTSQSPFTSKIQILCKISNASTLDTTSIEITDPAKEKSGWLLGQFSLKIPLGLWNLSIEFSDLRRNYSYTTYYRIDKSSTYTAQNYLPKFRNSNEPIFENSVPNGTEIVIESKRNNSLGAPFFLESTHNDKLPPPPFSTNNPEIASLPSVISGTLQKDGIEGFKLLITNSDYFITHDNQFKSGLFIRYTEEDFPNVKEVKSLEWPLRYITTKAEFDQIVKSTNPKKLIDNFWLECAGNKSRAKNLIRVYYSRVEEANYFFSSYTDGWRTDRGMIHLIFGNPIKITKQPDREIWQYGEDNTPNQLVFTFYKEANSLSDNIYILNRSQDYRTYWERMVSTWRSGRVYSD